MTNDFKPHLLERCGGIFFKFRAWIAVPFFISLVLFSRSNPDPYICFALVFTGICIRIWAAGYIGEKARNNTFSTPYRIASGPYRYVKHPLYIGNAFLVIGVTLLYNPPLLYELTLIVLFMIMYGMIIMSERAYIKKLPQRKASFQIKNCKGEISTIGILLVIMCIHLIVPKNII